MRASNLWTLGLAVLLIGGAIAAADLLVSRQALAMDSDVAVIRGTVRSSDGTPLYGILVKAKGEGKSYSTSVFTNADGKYDFPPLPLGLYEVTVGTQWSETVQLAASGAAQDFAVQLGKGFMNQTTAANWLKVLPGSDEGKRLISRNCASCHPATRLILRAPASPEDWAPIVSKMETNRSGSIIAASLGPYNLTLTPADKKTVVDFLTANVKEDTKDTYAAKAMERPTGEAARAVFTEWDLSSVGGIGEAWADTDGTIWFLGRSAIGRLDPNTGETREWPTPMKLGLHDVMGHGERQLWITASQGNKIVNFNMGTHEFKVFDIPPSIGAYPHTGDFDQDGNYWFTLNAGPKSGVGKLDPRTGVMTKYDVPVDYANTYGLAVDQKGNVWFSELNLGKVGKFDRSGKLTEYTTPSPDAGPRRVQIDSKGKVWFTECYVSKIAVLDPDNGKISEYDTGIPNGFPYMIKIDKFDKIWFDSLQGNLIGMFDQKTKKALLTLVPTPDGFARDASFDYYTNPYTIVYASSGQNVIGRMYFRK